MTLKLKKVILIIPGPSKITVFENHRSIFIGQKLTRNANIFGWFLNTVYLRAAKLFEFLRHFCFMFWFAKVDPINSWLFLSKLIFVGRSFGFDLVISGEPTPLVKWYRRDHLLLGDEDDYLQISQTRRNKAYNEINICLQIGNVQLW